MANRLSPEQYEIIRSTIRSHGDVYALAASNAGISLTYLKRVLVDDEDFAQELSDCVAEFNDAVKLMMQQRANTSDSILIELARATNAAFTPEGRKQALQQTGRPNRLVLRTFDDDGKEAGVTDVVEKQQPAAPLQLELDRNRI